MAEIVWRNYLRTKTRNPRFLWKMVISILTIGVVVGLAVDASVPAWINTDEVKEEEATDTPKPTPEKERWNQLGELADNGQWQELFYAIPELASVRWHHWGTTALAVLTAACWMSFLLQAIQIRGPADYRWWGALLGLALGVVSIWPTIFFIFWQERVWGLVESAELAAGIRDNVLGVGLREELSKFICFLPLLPLVVWKRDELAALLLAGAVGLGFAMEENIGYVGASAGTQTIGRLLMPAPFHMAMTGLIGLAAYRACVWPRQCGPVFIAIFGVVAMAHGFYDAFILVEVLAEYSIVTSLIFILLMYQFFRELRALQRTMPNSPVSLTANFLFCISTVAAATFIYLSAAIGSKMAGDVMVLGIVAESVMVYLFLREMPETMVTV
ncbi:PrsW family glutamic-type intramembrane protease [Lacipirellula parvula]|uniref:PrsW family intramembrane metalloprotease n=1 Tax=Lacipirellula parvula TaxID=2650471 RepID=A0A5K7XHC5_9BACT|nr:PrsW family glutamic-type intramembrane protease [Lacipirellula parvula]BBO35442.1 hypothetical protein PLANPX_5054 [Lacipirellula parvula]